MGRGTWGLRFGVSCARASSASWRPMPPPVLILMKGHPGTGKSTLANALAKKLSWPLIDKDDVRDCTLHLQAPLPCEVLAHAEAAPNPGGPPRVVDAGVLNELAYEVMWRVAARQLALGLSVVVDCPLARAALFGRGLDLAHATGAKLGVLECRPGDTEEWRRRLEGRAAAESALPLPGGEVPRASDILPGGGPPGEGPTPGCHVSGGAGGTGIRHHKPQTWAELQRLLDRYGGCWEFATGGGVPKLVVDTTALSREASLAAAYSWAMRLLDE